MLSVSAEIIPVPRARTFNLQKTINSFIPSLKIAAALLLALTGCNSAFGASTSTTSPNDNPVAKSFGWTKACEDRIAAAQGQPIDTIFIGDSITQNFYTPGFPGRTVWDKYYGSHSLNLGVGSDGTEHVLWRLEHEDIASFTPKAVVLLIGVNDAQFSPHDIAAGVRAVLDKIQALYPAAKIVLMNILPTTRATENIKAANAIIQTFADNQTIFSLDLWPQMPPVGDNWVGVGGDHLHLNTQGYEIWAAALNPLLDKISNP